MKGMPIVRLKRLKRTAVLLGAGTLVAGASLLGATQAHAALGTHPGTITLNPATGPTSTTGITYHTTIPCPAGNTGSANVRIVDPATSQQAALAPNNNAVTAPFSGTFNATFALAAQQFPDIIGKTSKIVVQCFSGASGTGTAVAVMDTFVTIDAAGSTYTISSSGGTTATGGNTIPISVTVTSATPTATSATPTTTSATPAAAPATGGGTGPGSSLALAATGAAVVLAGGGLILLAKQRRRQGAG